MTSTPDTVTSNGAQHQDDLIVSSFAIQLFGVQCNCRTVITGRLANFLYETFGTLRDTSRSLDSFRRHLRSFLVLLAYTAHWMLCAIMRYISVLLTLTLTKDSFY